MKKVNRYFFRKEFCKNDELKKKVRESTAFVLYGCLLITIQKVITVKLAIMITIKVLVIIVLIKTMIEVMFDYQLFENSSFL